MSRSNPLQSQTRKLLLILALLGLSTWGFAQAVFLTTGSWETAGNWSAGNIGDLVSENVTINNNRVALINNGSDYTIGNLTIANNSGLTINTTGVLNVGDVANSRDLTASNGASITVTGTLVIWGDLIVVNNLSLSVSGTLIIKGNIQMGNNASLSITGSVDVDGDFIAGNNANVTISGGGHVNVDGSVSVGNNGNLTGPPGSFTAGNCGQGSGSNFCNGGVLPVELLYFKAIAQVNQVDLNWVTASELNSDYFEVEKSEDGLTYDVLARVQAAGTTNERVDYQVIDEKPQPGKTYYRLKQADLDGKVSTLGVVLVDYDGFRNSTVYPNPLRVGNDLTVELNFKPKYSLEITVYDLAGRLLKRIITKESSVALSVNLSAGLYLLRIASPEYQGVNRFSVSE